MYKIDLHTHSIASPDGALRARDYEFMLSSGRLDAVAVTDHDTVEFALELNSSLGETVIVGEEITSSEGEIIGLFLTRRIPSLLTPEETIRHIREQAGLVCIPHPFESVRKGIQPEVLERIAHEVDIIEIFNGRAYFQNRSAAARRWAKIHSTAAVANSDAHGRRGWGRTYTSISELPVRDNLVSLLARPEYSLNKVGFTGMLYPKFNRLRKRLSRDS